MLNRAGVPYEPTMDALMKSNSFCVAIQAEGMTDCGSEEAEKWFEFAAIIGGGLEKSTWATSLIFRGRRL